MCRRRGLGVSLCALLGLAGSAQAQGAGSASSITNTAQFLTSDREFASNTVTLGLRDACRPEVSPDSLPARTFSSDAPDLLLIPYRVANVGALAGRLILRPGVVGAAPDGVQVQVQLESTGVGAAVEALDLGPAEAREVFLAVLLPAGATGALDVNLAASCGPLGDLDNRAQVQLRAGQNLLVSHEATPARVAVADTAQFTLKIRNPLSQAARASLQVTLPPGLLYQAGSASVPLEVSPDGRILSAAAVNLSAAGTTLVTYRATVSAEAMPAAGRETTLSVVAVTRASVAGQTLGSNDATARLQVTAGVFDRRATLTGEVFLDHNANSVRDPGDEALEGVRLLLPNGQQAVSGSFGRYAFRDLMPGPWLVSLDPATVPYAAVPGAGSRVVDVHAVTRADFALNPPQARMPGQPATPSQTSVQRGPVLVNRSVTPAGSGSLVTLTVQSARLVLDVLILDESSSEQQTREFRIVRLDQPVTFRYITSGPAGPSTPEVLWREP